MALVDIGWTGDAKAQRRLITSSTITEGSQVGGVGKAAKSDKWLQWKGGRRESDESPKFGINVVAEPLRLEVGRWGRVLTAGLLLPGDRVHRLRAQSLLQALLLLLLLLSILLVLLVEARGGQAGGGVDQTKGCLADAVLLALVPTKDWHVCLHRCEESHLLPEQREDYYPLEISPSQDYERHLLEGLNVQLAFNTFGFAQFINFFRMLLQQLLYSFLLNAFLSFLELQLEIKRLKV